MKSYEEKSCKVCGKNDCYLLTYYPSMVKLESRGVEGGHRLSDGNGVVIRFADKKEGEDEQRNKFHG